jgi:mRNA interferase HigB
MLRDFCQSHADACDSLYGWYRVANKAQWNNLTEVQATYKTAEAVGILDSSFKSGNPPNGLSRSFTVFNIKGNS